MAADSVDNLLRLGTPFRIENHRGIEGADIGKGLVEPSEGDISGIGQTGDIGGHAFGIAPNIRKHQDARWQLRLFPDLVQAQFADDAPHAFGGRKRLQSSHRFFW